MNVNGLEYHLETDGSGTPLMMLHGFMGSSASWDSIQSGLAKRFQLIMPDLPGHGKTTFTPQLERYQMPTIAYDLATMMSAERFHLLGYSMGGRLALYFAIHYPHRIGKLILISGSPGLATVAERAQRQHVDDALADRMDDQPIEQVIDEWEQLPLWQASRLEPSARQQLRLQRLQHNPQGLAMSLRGMGTGIQPSLWEQLSQLQLPTLLIVGQNDRKFVHISQEMIQQLPNASIEIIPDVGHSVHLEAPTETVARILRFLAGVA